MMTRKQLEDALLMEEMRFARWWAKMVRAVGVARKSMSRSRRLAARLARLDAADQAEKRVRLEEKRRRREAKKRREGGDEGGNYQE